MVRPSRTRFGWDVGSETQATWAWPGGRGHSGAGPGPQSGWGPVVGGGVMWGREWWARPGRAWFRDLGGGSDKRRRDPGVVATPGPGSPRQQLPENFAG